eukprot:SM000226S07404  [mRNA]  locus=s226:143510:146562:+ [translate_table: standard]
MAACIALTRSVTAARQGEEPPGALQADPLLETLDTLMPVATLVRPRTASLSPTFCACATSQTGTSDSHLPAEACLVAAAIGSAQANVTSERSREEAQTIGDAELLQIPLPGLDAICKELLNEPGILSVVQGRQALEQRVVSQDLELWLSNAPAEDGRYTLLARAGRQVQEVQVSTTLDREGMKAAVQRVTMRLALLL